MSGLIEPDSWASLQRHTRARIALGRAGNGLPTEALLAFNLAQAQARDAVHLPLRKEALQQALAADNFEAILIESAAESRSQYLQNPSAGRRLSERSRTLLCDLASSHSVNESLRPELAVVVADGLSAVAPDRHALPLLHELRNQMQAWRLGPVLVATQARVALADEVGEILGAEATIILIGERPGLSWPDSLGAYLTYRPVVGCVDAQRNCVSNIHAQGLGYAEAARKLTTLLQNARRYQVSGVKLRDSDDPSLLDEPSVPGAGY